MHSERIQVAVRVLDSICAGVPPRMEDVVALRGMAESAKEEKIRLSELACKVIVREREKSKPL
jgi:hypothetical protein